MPLRTFRLLLAFVALLAVQGCAALSIPVVTPPLKVPPPDGAFVMLDGARLPYRSWMPVTDGPDGRTEEPWAVILALHGFNDSRDAWEIPAPVFQRAGIALFAPDQRGFGAAPDRGFWPGEALMVNDIVTMARELRARYPRAKLILMGESMGGALLMRTATATNPPPVDGYVLVAPAVWGRKQMGILLSTGLWLVSGLAPGLEVTGSEVPMKIRASDNREALLRLARDPLTIHRTRFDALRGLTDEMDAAQDAAPDFRAPALFLYGGKDQLVPKGAMAAMWRKLPPRERRAFYPNGYHLMLRDQDRALPIEDIIAWIRNPEAPLPSGAEVGAHAWLASRE